MPVAATATEVSAAQLAVQTGPTGFQLMPETTGASGITSFGALLDQAGAVIPPGLRESDDGYQRTWAGGGKAVGAIVLLWDDPDDAALAMRAQAMAADPSGKGIEPQRLIPDAAVIPLPLPDPAQHGEMVLFRRDGALFIVTGVNVDRNTLLGVAVAQHTLGNSLLPGAVTGLATKAELRADKKGGKQNTHRRTPEEAAALTANPVNVDVVDESSPEYRTGRIVGMATMGLLILALAFRLGKSLLGRRQREAAFATSGGGWSARL
jgi:hypothetical protein